jgi:hypothetical protein
MTSSYLFESNMNICPPPPQTMTTVGYGDISPVSTNERLFAIIAMVIGALIFGYGISAIVAMVAAMNAESNKFKLKMDKVNTNF